MQAAQEIRRKLILVIGNLICRCIEEARKIPYILDQEQVVNILVGNPSFFEKLVREEQRDRTAFSSASLTAKLDAISELGQFEALDAFEVSFSGPSSPSVDPDAILDQLNRLTRTFVVYHGNMVTIFEKEFQEFMEKFRSSLQQSGMSLRTTELTPSDMVGLEKRAEDYLTTGQFLQAFSFDRLLNSQVITKGLVSLPAAGYSLSRNLMETAVEDVVLFTKLVKFVLRVCYVSQGTWQDLFATLLDLVDQEPARHRRSLLIDRIEQDGIFCCNLLCESYAVLREWPAGERRTAIERGLERWRRKPASA